MRRLFPTRVVELGYSCFGCAGAEPQQIQHRRVIVRLRETLAQRRARAALLHLVWPVAWL